MQTITKASNKFYGLVLVGGLSSRMGQDKASLHYHGRSQQEHMFETLKPFCECLFFSGRRQQVSSGDWIVDRPEYAESGPLAGILSALEAYPDKSWIVTAVDLPFVTTQTFECLIAHRDPQKIATAFKSNHDGLPEPLCTVWESHGLPKIKELFAQGIRCPRKVLIKSDVKLLEQKDRRWLDNVNTPEEYQEALKAIKYGHA